MYLTHNITIIELTKFNIKFFYLRMKIHSFPPPIVSYKVIRTVKD